VTIALVTLLAATLRFIALGDVPPGLYHDEAYNGLDALDVLAGQRPVYFAANNGREPLFIYLVAGTVGLLGRSPGALRLAAALCGTLTIPATYLMVRTWFGRRVAALSAAILAITLWHVHLSRIGLRAVTLPLMTVLALWLGGRAYRSGRRPDWLTAGLGYGLCFYTYLPARITPLALAAFALIVLLKGQRRRIWPSAIWFASGAALTLFPLALYTLTHWDVVIGRVGQASVLNPLINAGRPWQMLGRQLIDTLGMFLIRGDRIARHNAPGRPVFGVLLGAALVWGTVRAVRQATRRMAPTFVLIWIGLMVTPTWLAEDAPHFLRAAGILPLIVILPALGLDAAIDWWNRRSRDTLGWILVAAILTISLFSTVREYFFRYGLNPETAYAFEDAATELAAEANRFAGAGWDGRGLLAQPRTVDPEGHVYVDRRLWKEWAAVPFLVSESVRTDRLSEGANAFSSEATLFLIWPYDDLTAYRRILPTQTRITPSAGPLTRGDLEDQPYPAYLAYQTEPYDASEYANRALFGNQIALTNYTVEEISSLWQVTLEWRAIGSPEENYTVFVHLRDETEIIAQDDGEPAQGAYPTSLWRTGDVIVDTHWLNAPDKSVEGLELVVGLYRWPTMDHLEATSPSGDPIGKELTLHTR